MPAARHAAAVTTGQRSPPVPRSAVTGWRAMSSPCGLSPNDTTAARTEPAIHR